MLTTKAHIDWDKLGFEYIPTKSYIRYSWTRERGWDDGALICEPYVQMHVAEATVLHYGQSAFEGLKAFQMKDGKVRIFRPELNAQRLQDSCAAVSMEAPPLELFLDGVQRVVSDNIDFVPPYGKGSLYIRPFVIGTGPQLGLTPAKEYQFVVMVNPVGDFYQGGMGKPVKALIKYGFDRAAPNGTGHVKLAGNYAPVFKPSADAKKRDYQVMLFLDSRTHQYIEEFATSNFIALSKPDEDGRRVYATSLSKSILPSVTNRSLMEIAEKKFKWKVEKRHISWREVESGMFEEIAACGTAVVITPVAQIDREVLKLEAEEKIKADPFAAEDLDENDFTIDRVTLPQLSDDGLINLYHAYKSIQFGESKDWQDYRWMWPAEGL